MNTPNDTITIRVTDYTVKTHTMTVSREELNCADFNLAILVQSDRLKFESEDIYQESEYDAVEEELFNEWMEEAL